MENEINKILEEIFETLDKSLPKKNAQVVRAVARTRLTIADILAKHTSSDGKIPRSRLNAVLNDLAALEGEIYRNLRTELQIVLSSVAEQTTVALAEAIVAIVGLILLIEFGGLSKALMDLSVGAVEAIFSELTGSTYRRYIESTTRSAFNRKEQDDLVLNDRLRNIAKVLRKEVETTLRESIRKGEVTTELLRKIDRTYSDLDWRLKTIIETELMYVMRQVVAKFAEESGLVKALKIVDFPHGNNHERHNCYIYAHRDEYGLGEGIYPVGTRKIRNPHPRCRSMLLFVLTDGLN